MRKKMNSDKKIGTFDSHLTHSIIIVAEGMDDFEAQRELNLQTQNTNVSLNYSNC